MYLDLEKIKNIDTTHIDVHKNLNIEKIAYKFLYDIGFRYIDEQKELITYIDFLDENIYISLYTNNSSSFRGVVGTSYYTLKSQLNIKENIYIEKIQTYNHVEKILKELKYITDIIQYLEEIHLKNYNFIKDILEKNNTTEILLKHERFNKISIEFNKKLIMINNCNILGFNDVINIQNNLIPIIEECTVKNNINFEKFVNDKTNENR